MVGSSSDNLLVNKIFSVALEKKATDIHLMAGNYPVFRLDDPVAPPALGAHTERLAQQPRKKPED